MCSPCGGLTYTCRGTYTCRDGLQQRYRKGLHWFFVLQERACASFACRLTGHVS
jgi:hypothetical protein